MKCHNKTALTRLKSTSKDRLEQAYVECGRNSTVLARKLRLSRCAVENRLRILGIKIRTLSEFCSEHNLSKNDSPLTRKQDTLILGSMLGDACLHAIKNSQNLVLRFCHSVRQFGYLEHKHRVFSGRASRLYKMPQNNFGSTRWSFSFQSTREAATLFRSLSSRWRKNSERGVGQPSRLGIYILLV